MCKRRSCYILVLVDICDMALALLALMFTLLEIPSCLLLLFH